MLTLTIGVDDKTSLLDANSLQWHDELRVKNTISFNMTDPAGAYRPAVGQDVQLEKSGTTIFGGTIDEVTEKKEDGDNDCLRFSVVAIGYEEIFDRHIIYGNYLAHTCGEIIQHMIDDFMPSEGFTHTNTLDGCTIADLGINYMKASDVMESLCDLSGHSWYIDHDKDVHFFNRTANPAPLYLSDSSDNYRKMYVKYHRQNYRNIQWITDARGLTGSRIETFLGDGAAMTFALAYPVAYKPTHITIDGGADLDVGLLGVDTGKDWYWAYDSNIISQDDGGTPLSAIEVLAVTYEGMMDIVTRVQNGEEVTLREGIEGGSGYYEAVEQDSELIGKDLTIERASALVRRYGLMPVEVTFETDSDGLRAGQCIDIDITSHDIDGQYLITKVKGNDVDSKFMRYTITAINGEPRGGWSSFFRMLGARGTSANVTHIGNEYGVMMIGQAIATDVLAVVPSMSFEASADVYVNQSSPNANFSYMAIVFVAYHDASDATYSLVKFDISVLLGKTITSAKLVLCRYPYWGEYPPTADNVMDIEVHRVDDDWSETGVTWNSMPSYNPSVTDVQHAQNLTSVEWDITSLMQGWAAGGANYGVLLKADEDAWDIWASYRPAYCSREDADAAKRPKLVVEYI